MARRGGRVAKRARTTADAVNGGASASAEPAAATSSSSAANGWRPPSYQSVQQKTSGGGGGSTSLVAPLPTSVLKSTVAQLEASISLDLTVAAQREASFLRMIDRKAPVLYEHAVVLNAIRRYELFWLPLQAQADTSTQSLLVPPLDVHWVWHTHMLSPTTYAMDCKQLVGRVIDHRLPSADEIQRAYEASVAAWTKIAGPDEPYDILSSPPTLRSAQNAHKQRSSYDIASAVQRQRNFNYQVSLPHYTSAKFVAAALQRYLHFLQLKQTYGAEFLTPAYDFDLVWHAHQVHPSAYERDCTAILGKVLRHDDSVDDRSTGSKLLTGESATKQLWQTHFPDEPFWRRGAMFRGHVAPALLGLETSDVASATGYGELRVPSISLRDLPVQRQHLRLRLSYGRKKMTTFNADLSQKQVTRAGFSLVWQPTDASQSASILRFPFERRLERDLLVELDLYDKLLLQRKDLVRLQAHIPLAQLLGDNKDSRPGQTHAVELTLTAKDGTAAADATDRNGNSRQDANQQQQQQLAARATLVTSVAVTRELQLSVGEFTELLVGGAGDTSRLFALCQAASLQRNLFSQSSSAQPVSVHVATHALTDVRDGQRFVVQIVHAAGPLLSAVLVWAGAGAADQRLVAMAHLVGADSLPTRDQLDPALAFLPHLSTADERAFVVLNRDGDYAIVKGKWNGFARKQLAVKTKKAKPGSPGRLQIEAFNLLKNTVQKFEVPSADGSTVFVIGEAQAQLSGRRVDCRSAHTAESLAAVFAVSTLFVLCNPDKIRLRTDATTVGLQAHRWPLTLASGYGRPQAPTNRSLAGIADGSVDAALPSMLATMCSVESGCCTAAGASCGASCGACGACGGCGGCGGCGAGCAGCGA